MERVPAAGLSPAVSGIYLNRNALDSCFDEHGQQRIALPARITGEMPALDALLHRSGWRRIKAESEEPLLHNLLAESFSGAEPARYISARER